MRDLTAERENVSDKVHLFGPQSRSFGTNEIETLRTELLEEKPLEWIALALRDLTLFANAFHESRPNLFSEHIVAPLSGLHGWLEKDQNIGALHPLPNVISTPLIVANHLKQYQKFHDLDGRCQGTDLSAPATLGFCVGMLAATVVSLSHTREQFERNGEAAIRLAMLIGAITDSQVSVDPTAPARTLAVSWSSSESRECLTRILKDFDDAYVSVQYDHNRVSVTISHEKLEVLRDALCSSHLTANEIGLSGRFHSAVNQHGMNILTAASEDNIFPLLRANQSTPEADGLVTLDILRAILVDKAEWIDCISKVYKMYPDALYMTYGLGKCIPPSISRVLAPQQTSYMAEVEGQPDLSQSKPGVALELRPGHTDSDIAVIGLGCHLPGAENADELWQTLLGGQSQHTNVPADRFAMHSAFRAHDPPHRKWYGNFIKDHDCFDHKFFKNSPREAASMDPQQRLLLQVTYQALEQAGYFAKSHSEREVGCFIGVVSNDYQNNVACHDANAYTATGNLNSFIAGKVSHFFGWTGPAMVIDTACSASAVAIHQACRAILAGDCHQAVAGGSLVFTSPLWYQNLAGASFLSPSGSCKPFDAHADGYCRGEGIATVVLKRLSAALADGDQILGCIAGTDVRQNENFTPIVVPNSRSLSDLFKRVIHKANLSPSHISVVEAHGTGTAIGDPAEWNSIRTVLGGDTHQRSEKLVVGSIKGHIGHTECTSGVAALIKVLLMMNYGKIPAQASFKTLNPAFAHSPADQMEVLTRERTWAATFRAALINNYGASGSNASMVVTQAFKHCPNPAPADRRFAKSALPILFQGNDEQAVVRNIHKVKQWIQDHVRRKQHLNLADLAFALARRANQTLQCCLMFSATSIEDLLKRLQIACEGIPSQITLKQATAKPLIMCFGGQVSNVIGLDRAIFEQNTVFRCHLQECSSAIQTAGYGSVFPEIFAKTPYTNPVKLQAALFAMQYACAKSWIASGLQVSALVGHSFGELTALCISGILSLDDAVKVICRRATLIAQKWGPEPGAMMAIEASEDELQHILRATDLVVRTQDETPATVACFNTATSFTIAGSSDAVHSVAQAASKFPSVRLKMLNVMNAFHSTLVEPLIEYLDILMQDIEFKSPQIPIMHSTRDKLEAALDKSYIARHLRQPVYFYNAVQRLAQEYPSAFWLEAGSASTITGMASRALKKDAAHNFQAVDITSGKGSSSLADATISLWSAGITVSHWSHHPSQAQDFIPVFLPPYQFEKSRHWLELKDLPSLPNASHHPQEKSSKRDRAKLWEFVDYLDATHRAARFRICTESALYDSFVSGHTIAREAPICPATLQIDVAIDALASLRPSTSHFHPTIMNVRNLAPMCNHLTRMFHLVLSAVDEDGSEWDWEISSTGDSAADSVLHVTGKISVHDSRDGQLLAEVKKRELTVSHKRCQSLLNDPDPDESMKGSVIYRAFSDVVDYSDQYCGLQKLVGKGMESAGRVKMTRTGDSWFDPLLTDAFSHTGGIWVNCMTNRSSSVLYLANAIEKWIRSPSMSDHAALTGTWDVFATHRKASDKNVVTDIYVFDAISGQLMEMIIGINYAQVSVASLQRLLAGESKAAHRSEVRSVELEADVVAPAVQSALSVIRSPADSTFESKASKLGIPKLTNTSIVDDLCGIIAELTGLSIDGFEADAQLNDLGVDSLMSMELIAEIEKKFEIRIPHTKAIEAFDIPGLAQIVRDVLGAESTAVSPESSLQISASRSKTKTNVSVTMNVAIAMSPASAINDAESIGLEIPRNAWSAAFKEMSASTDRSILECGFADYLAHANLQQTELCIAMICESLDQSGFGLAEIAPGSIARRIDHVPQHQRLTDWIYHTLVTKAGLLEHYDDGLRRTHVPLPNVDSQELCAAIVRDYPDNADATLLAFHCGSQLAKVLRGEETGVKIIFGSELGRSLVSKLYGDWPLNRMFCQQMRNLLKNLVTNLPRDQGPLRILEMGAGTGGTTKILAPALAALGFPVKYTFTDISPSFVTAAKKEFQQYDFMDFRVHDIEREPESDMLGSLHLVIASNAVHATRDLSVSTSNIRKALRPDGALLMLELTTPLVLMDMIFGLFEGWWLFNDGRNHAISSIQHWDSVLRSAGYSNVQWTDGAVLENEVERLILALADEPL